MTKSVTSLSALVMRHRVFLLILVCNLVLISFLNRYINPHHDYLDHWMQSRIFSLSYYEHPPMAALLIKAMTTVFGDSETGLKTAAFVTNMAILAFAYALSCKLFGMRAGIFTLLGLESTLYFIGKLTSIQTEQVLLLSWLAALGLLLRYLKTNAGYWLLAVGFCAGIGALSKYTMILFYISSFVYYTWVPTRRREWINPWQYLGGLTALVTFSPVIYWNYLHDWVSFKFQFAKGSTIGEFFGAASLAFLFSIVFVYSVFLTVWGGIRLVKRIKALHIQARNGQNIDSPEALLMTLSVMPLLFFLVILLNGDYSDPQWAAPGMITFFIWLGKEASDYWQEIDRKKIRRLFFAALLLNIGTMVVISVHVAFPFLPYRIDRDPADGITGWRQTGELLETYLLEQRIPLPEYIVTVSYPLGAELGFYLSSRPKSYSLTREKRNLWSDPADMNRENTLFACQFECDDLVKKSERKLGFKIVKIWEIRQPLRGDERVIGIYRLPAE